MFKILTKHWAFIALIFVTLTPAQAFTKDQIEVDEPGIASAHPLARQADFKI